MRTICGGRISAPRRLCGRALIYVGDHGSGHVSTGITEQVYAHASRVCPACIAALDAAIGDQTTCPSETTT